MTARRRPRPAPLYRRAVAVLATILIVVGVGNSARVRGQPVVRPPFTDASLTRADVAVTLRYGPSPADTMAARDRWIARDKALHVSVSGLLTLSAQYLFERKAGWGRHDALPVAVGSAAAVGVAKEVYDSTQPTETASGKDLVADMVGIGLATGIILL